MSLRDNSSVGASAKSSLNWLRWKDAGEQPAREYEIAALGSIETLGPAIDKYELSDFAQDDWPRFSQLISYLSPRDQEIMLLFAVLRKRPTDLSILFGKAGHRVQEDIHKAAHKIAGLIEFGTQPTITRLDNILVRNSLHAFRNHSFAACLWQYARCRDFSEMSRILGTKGLRQHMLRSFKILHATRSRDEGLLAGWILWLVADANEHGKGWKKRQRGKREHKLGPTVFTTTESRYAEATTKMRVPVTGRGGRGQRPNVLKLQRHMKFALRG
jgi:hypothetical protein